MNMFSESSRPLRIPTLSLALAAALAGCGGGGGGSTSVSPSSVTTSGAITGFGSIYVNGVRYDTSAAQVEFEDDSSATEADLKLGMKVVVVGTRSGASGTATRILFDDELKGALDAAPVIPDPADPKTGSFSVGGFTIETDGLTVFDDGIVGDLNGLAAGDFVEVSAFPTATGFRATRVERKDDLAGSTTFEVKGTITDAAGLPDSFVLDGRLTVTLNGATAFDDGLTAAGLAEGQFVEVKGSLAGGTLNAVKVEGEDDLFDDTDGDIEIEGFVQSIPDAVTIVVAGFRISVPDSGAFSVGQKVELKVNRVGDTLVLVSFEDEREETVRLEDTVMTVAGDRFTTRLGIEVVFSGGSRLEDDVTDDERLTVPAFANLLQPGDRIEARGVVQGDGSVLWTRVAREDDDDTDCRLRAAAASISDPTFTLLDVIVDTTTVGDNDFEDDNDQPLGRAGFFGRLTAGAVVEAESDAAGSGCQDGRLTARKAEFE